MSYFDRPFMTFLVCCFIVFAGCATFRTSETSRTGLEQLLISDAVDKTLDSTPLPPIENRKVFLDTQYLDCVDKGYLIGSLRQRLLLGGAALVDKKEDSEVTIEIVSGGVGTDNSNSFVGMPGIALPGPLPVTLPEVRLYDKSRQSGTAKISIVAFDTATGTLLHDSGNSMAISTDNRWSVMGMGPYMEGDVRRQLNAAQRSRGFNGGTRSANSSSAPLGSSTLR